MHEVSLKRGLTSNDLGSTLRRVAWLAFTILLFIATAYAWSSAQRALRILEPSPLPTLPAPPIVLLYDERPVTVTISVAWQKVQLAVPTDRVTSDRTLWQQMHFEDWNTVAPALRERALSAMAASYRRAGDGPRGWATMTADDWDEVPQPIRAMAFIGMARYWVRHYRIGLAYGLSSALVANTVAAIIMVESWFEHRGAYTNADGSEDVGLGGSSAYCRDALRRLHADGRVDFLLRDQDYFNPWFAARAVSVWFGLMLDEADGDLDMAIRAYHTGIAVARAGEGAEYGANVVRKRRRFIGNRGAPPAWAYLFTRMGAAPAIR